MTRHRPCSLLIVLLLGACRGPDGGPVIDSPPASQTVVDGAAVNFVVTASGQAPLRYQWRRDEMDVANATMPALNLSSVRYTDDGARFSVLVTDAAGASVQSPVAVLTVTPRASVITQQPQDVSVQVGEQAAFEVVVTEGSAPVTYQWQRDGAALAGATAARLSLPVVALADDGARFGVLVTNPAGTVTSTVATLSVSAIPRAPMITTQPQPQSIFAGQTAQFTVLATGSAPLTYQWQRDGVAIAGATSESYTTPQAGLADDGALFSVIVSNATPPAATSMTALLRVSRAPSPVAQVLAHSASTLVRLEDGTMWHWGQNISQGTGKAVRVTVSGMDFTDVSQVSGRGTHVLARRTDGSVWGWGTPNNQGEVGNGSLNAQPEPGPVFLSPGVPLTGIASVTAGQQFSVALRTNGTVVAWGLNQLGLLGDGLGDSSYSVSLVPVEVIDSTTDGGLSGVTMLAAGERHTIALRTDGTVWAWGANSNGQLGDGTLTFRNKAQPVETGPGVALGSVMAIAAGQRFSLAVKTDGTVWAWGQAGPHLCRSDFNVQQRPQQVLDAQGAAFTGAATVAGGLNSTSILKTDGTVWSCGQNGSGQLGDGTSLTRTSPTQVVDDAGVPFGSVDQLSLTFEHVVVRRADKSVWAWGSDGSNQLGSAATGSMSSIPVQSTTTSP